MDNFRFKGTCKESIFVALVYLAFPCALLVMSIKGLLDMSPTEDNTMQIVGVATMSVLLLMALVYLAHTLLFRIVVEDKTIKACLLLGYPDRTYRRTAPRKAANVIWK